MRIVSSASFQETNLRISKKKERRTKGSKLSRNWGKQSTTNKLRFYIYHIDPAQRDTMKHMAFNSRNRESEATP